MIKHITYYPPGQGHSTTLVVGDAFYDKKIERIIVSSRDLGFCIELDDGSKVTFEGIPYNVFEIKK